MVIKSGGKCYGMKERDGKRVQRPRRLNGESGFSIVEMMIVVVMIAVVTGWAVLRISEAQQSVRLAGATQELTAYLDKARLDSIRRHATAVSQMAQVSITSPTSYSVTLDTNGDGELDPARVFDYHSAGITFNVATYPTTILYNWRGRVVDDEGHQINDPSPITLRDAHGSGPAINLSAMGDTTTYGNVNTTNVNVSNVNNDANIRRRTQVPE
jgi:prepilin-type N-terminal cleavage/methylation domain-containing protein